MVEFARVVQTQEQRVVSLLQEALLGLDVKTSVLDALREDTSLGGRPGWSFVQEPRNLRLMADVSAAFDAKVDEHLFYQGAGQREVDRIQAIGWLTKLGQLSDAMSVMVQMSSPAALRGTEMCVLLARDGGRNAPRTLHLFHSLVTICPWSTKTAHHAIKRSARALPVLLERAFLLFEALLRPMAECVLVIDLITGVHP